MSPSLAWKKLLVSLNQVQPRVLIAITLLPVPYDTDSVTECHCIVKSRVMWCMSKNMTGVWPFWQNTEESLIYSDQHLSFRDINNQNFQWKGLRLLARRSPHFFLHSNQPAMPLPSYLELMISKIAKEMPVSLHPCLPRIEAMVTLWNIQTMPWQSCKNSATVVEMFEVMPLMKLQKEFWSVWCLTGILVNVLRYAYLTTGTI